MDTDSPSPRTLLTGRIALGIAAIWTAALALLLIWNLASTQEASRDILTAQAQAHFQQLLTTRSWNSQHGGVYVPATAESPPNPFLDDSLRAAETTDGRRLALVNPAYMVRQISELTEGRNLVQFRMMSDRPLNPRNTPDPWEADALAVFISGEARELGELLLDGPEPTFRYVAPLLVEPACLSCHAKQGYSVGEVRGGMSLSIQAAPVLRAESLRIRNIFLAYGAIWLMGLLGIGGAARRVGAAEKGREAVIEDLRQALGEVRTLHGLLPICASCKNIRNDSGYWEDIEVYVEERSDAAFTHGICPECALRLYGDLAEETAAEPVKP